MSEFPPLINWFAFSLNRNHLTSYFFFFFFWLLSYFYYLYTWTKCLHHLKDWSLEPWFFDRRGFDNQEKPKIRLRLAYEGLIGLQWSFNFASRWSISYNIFELMFLNFDLAVVYCFQSCYFNLLLLYCMSNMDDYLIIPVNIFLSCTFFSLTKYWPSFRIFATSWEKKIPILVTQLLCWLWHLCGTNGVLKVSRLVVVQRLN